jgi:hypothetical protein
MVDVRSTNWDAADERKSIFFCTQMGLLNVQQVWHFPIGIVSARSCLADMQLVTLLVHRLAFAP